MGHIAVIVEVLTSVCLAKRQGLGCLESKAPLCRGSCHGNAVTEGVYAIDTVKVIVR